MVLYERKGRDIDRGLVGHWKLDDLKLVDATKARDYVKFKDGAISGAVAANDIRGKSNEAMAFDGVDDYVGIPHDVSQLGANLSNGFTISAWINPKSIGETAGRILDKSTSSIGAAGFYYAISPTNNTIGFRINIGTEKFALSNSVLYNVWTHVLVTISSVQICTHYINGALSGTPGDLVQPISTITTTNVMRIGNRSTATDRTFDGGIKNVRFYNRVLSQSEITKLYRGKL